MPLASYQNAYARAVQDDRSAPRRSVYLAATLRPSGGTAFATTVTDISLSGFSVSAVSGIHSGTLCWLSVGPLKGLQAEVIRNDGSTVGCAFSNLLNPAVLDSLLRSA